MGLSKGNTNNPHGRPVGAKNKFTVDAIKLAGFNDDRLLINSRVIYFSL